MLQGALLLQFVAGRARRESGVSFLRRCTTTTSPCVAFPSPVRNSFSSSGGYAHAPGYWQSNCVRFSRWREKGVCERLATALRGDLVTTQPSQAVSLRPVRAICSSVSSIVSVGNQGFGCLQLVFLQQISPNSQNSQNSLALFNDSSYHSHIGFAGSFSTANFQ